MKKIALHMVNFFLKKDITIFIYYQEVRIKIKGIEDFIKDYRDLVEGNNIPIIKKTGNLIIKEQDSKIKFYWRSNETKVVVNNKIIKKVQINFNPNDDITS